MVDPGGLYHPSALLGFPARLAVGLRSAGLSLQRMRPLRDHGFPPSGSATGLAGALNHCSLGTTFGDSGSPS